MRHSWQSWILLVVLTGLVFSSRAGAWQGGRDFTGTINNTIRIRMTISQSGNVVRGTYLYEKIGKNIPLTGTLRNQQLILKETDTSGRQTGEFNGRFVNADTIEGTWSNGDGSKSFPFRLSASRSASPPAASSNDGINGEYARVDAQGRIEKTSGASINVRLLANGMVEIQGDATLVIDARRGNVRTGNVEGTYKLNGNRLQVKGEGEYDCALTITFGKGVLAVTNDNGNCGGLSVSFNGEYKRIGAAKFQ